MTDSVPSLKRLSSQTQLTYRQCFETGDRIRHFLVWRLYLSEYSSNMCTYLVKNVPKIQQMLLSYFLSLQSSLGGCKDNMLFFWGLSLTLSRLSVPMIWAIQLPWSVYTVGPNYPNPVPGLQNFQNFLSAGISMENFLSNFDEKLDPTPILNAKLIRFGQLIHENPVLYKKKSGPEII